MSDPHWSEIMLPRERIEQLESVNGDLRRQLAKSEARVAELESREDAMCDLSYANGAKQGFSLGQTNDNDGLKNIVATRYSGGVKELKRLRTQANELEAGGTHD
ncbi:MAG: hypothetical protein SVX28_04165 [Pseudomonadota bacterium]|nr:hypothetical protein [Pseudomonadota bacterium]